MDKTRYTVKVDSLQLDVVRAWGTLSAACLAMQSLLGVPSHADRVTVMSGQGQRVTYIDARVDEPGIIRYVKTD